MKKYSPNLDTSKIVFSVETNEKYLKLEQASYGKIAPHNGNMNEVVYFEDLGNEARSITGNSDRVMSVKFDPEILRDDAYALAIFSHETYEINRLSDLAEDRISLKQYKNYVFGAAQRIYMDKLFIWEIEPRGNYW